MIAVSFGMGRVSETSDAPRRAAPREGRGFFMKKRWQLRAQEVPVGKFRGVKNFHRAT